MIVIKNISKIFRQKQQHFKALDSVNLTAEQGDIVGIIGSSGAGKSTLIRCLNLLERPDSGQVIINGKYITKFSNRELSKDRKKIIMMLQLFNLLASRNVFDNVALPVELEYARKTEICNIVNELLKIVGLEDKVNS